MASVCKNNDWEGCENLKRAFNVDDVDVAASRRSVASDKVVDHQDNKITDGNKRNNRCVFQAVEPAQESEGYHDKPATRLADKS